MTFTNRNGMLYVSINGVRKTTKLKYSKENIKKFKSYYNDEEFFNNFNINKTVPTVVELCYEVLDIKEKYLKRNSYRSYSSLIQSRITPYFKNMYVTELKPIDVYNFYNTFSSSQTLNICHTILKSAFERAIIKNYIVSNPFIIKRPKLKTNYRINPFSFDEAKKLIDSSPVPIKNLIATLFFTGARTGEILGLKWCNVDFKNFSIKIDSQITMGCVDTPKTSSSERIIDMLPQCEFYLKEQFNITGSLEYVFVNEHNNYYTSTSVFKHMWVKLLKDLNLEYRSIYQTRHSFASNMISGGENPFWVSQMLGHKSLNTTLNKYSKYIKRNDLRKYTFLDF